MSNLGQLRTTSKGHRIAITKTRNGMYQVSVDSWLYGCYATRQIALFEAAERVRQLTGWSQNPPTLSAAFRRKIMAM